MSLLQLGWSEHFARPFEAFAAEGCLPARVSVVHRGMYILLSGNGEIDAELSGRFLHRVLCAEELPVTGDWVVVRPGGRLIDAILPRRTQLVRKRAGRQVEAQVLAANIDVLFVVTGLDGDFNPRRLERYLVLAAESGARPVIVLNKTDLCADVQGCVSDARALGAPVIALSAACGDNVEALSGYTTPGATAAFIGSSGAGKSSLVNRLLGQPAQATGPVREHDARGRHTTSRRELIPLPQGWLVVDTPGIREVALWAGAEGLAHAFSEVSELAARCRFRDCTHTAEPGCAVRDSLDAERLAAFGKLRRELDHLRRRQDQRAAAEEKARVKRIHREMRRWGKDPC